MTECEYCGDPATREDPFAHKPCCEGCYNLLIGSEPDDPRDGNVEP